MIRKLGEIFAEWAKRYVPHPFIFALMLTFLTIALGMALTPSSFFDMIAHWEQGFWDLLTFSMQMCLILVTGHALATSGPARRLIERLADLPKSPRGMVAVVGCVTGAAAILNWGLGLIIGALLAKEMGKSAERRGVRAHYPLLGAAGYMELLVWHGGLSGSAPLLIATPAHFLESEIGVIPISETLFSCLNIVTTPCLLLAAIGVLVLMTPHESDSVGASRFLRAVSRAGENPATRTDTPRPRYFAKRLENSMWPSVIVGLMGLGYVGYFFYANGFDLNLNILNFMFLFLGVLLHRTPANYVDAIDEAARSCSAIILQFPFYSGIMGMMRLSGLAGVMAGWFVAVSNSTTYPVFTFLSAGLVNLFVPSGGGQWAVQGPIMVGTAIKMGIPLPKIVLALAYGDQWTNMLQPFWALPLLGITGLEARDIVGYTMTVMLLTGLVILSALLLVPV